MKEFGKEGIDTERRDRGVPSGKIRKYGNWRDVFDRRIGRMGDTDEI